MFFFRAVIHLLIRSKIYQYIAYQRMAGNQLKKFLPVQRYFSPWKWKYNLHTTEFVFPITVKVTEPLRFFFCRFLLESAAGLFLVCVAAPRLSIWIFTFQKFRLEVLAVKYAPRKWFMIGSSSSRFTHILSLNGRSNLSQLAESNVEQWRRADTFNFGRGVPIGNYVRPITFIIKKEQRL